MKKPTIITLVAVGLFGLMQLIRPKSVPTQPAVDLAGVPKEVNDIIRRACYDCHSTQTNLRWYDQLSPVNFWTYDHVREGRKALDFTKWDSMATPAQNNALYYSLNKVMEGEMPLPSYLSVHPQAGLSAEDKELLKGYILSRTPRKMTDSTQVAAAEKEYSQALGGKTPVPAMVKPAPNGIAYIPGYRNWQVMSTTDRFDNGTMRIIFANDVAVKAIQEHQTKVWPNGAIFAKTAWKEQVNADGSVTAGAFFQVEFMIKDSKKYAKTGGWGWARWRGDGLKPYGANISFTSECMSCHKPMESNDLVFTQPLSLLSSIGKNK
jgi:hypothetical protein